MTEIIDLELDKIRIDGGTQSRASMNNEVVNEYTTLIEESMVDFPPVTVFYDGSDYWLGDGFHRVEAHKLAFRKTLKTIKAEVRQGTQRDAILHSVGANANHGLRRTNADKRRAVEKLLYDDEWCQWSDREIARRCGVSAPTVASVRRDVEASLGAGVKNLHLNKRIGADGKTYTVKNKHWSEGAHRFTDKVIAYGLGRLEQEEIINRIQKGAKTLADLKMSRDDAYHALRKVAIAHHSETFKKGDYVKMATGRLDHFRFGKVHDILPESLDVLDFKRDMIIAWKIDGCMPSTKEEWEASLPNADEPKTQFEPGETVTTKSGHAGVVRTVNNAYVEVETVNGTRAYKPDHIAAAEPIEHDEQQEPDKLSLIETALERLNSADALISAIANEDAAFWELRKQCYRLINAVEHRQIELQQELGVVCLDHVNTATVQKDNAPIASEKPARSVTHRRYAIRRI